MRWRNRSPAQSARDKAIVDGGGISWRIPLNWINVRDSRLLWHNIVGLEGLGQIEALHLGSGLMLWWTAGRFCPPVPPKVRRHDDHVTRAFQDHCKDSGRFGKQ